MIGKSHKQLKLVDLRRVKNIIYQPVGIEVHKNQTLDEVIYKKYEKLGDSFLNSLIGSFAFVYQTKSGEIFAVRDWIGEVPLHFIICEDKIYFANFIEDLKSVDGYHYNNVIALNRSQTLSFKSNRIEAGLYYNFNQQQIDVSYSHIDQVAQSIRQQLEDSVKNRLEAIDKKASAILLSGGIDSMSVAYLASQMDKNIPAYTLQIGDLESTDVKRAKIIAKRFGIKHRIVKVEKSTLTDHITKSVVSSEIYHLYNVFCALGMDILADKLRKDGIKYVFTGEGGNECFGDYYDWVVKDNNNNQVVLQTTSKDFETPEGREAYVWGNLAAEAVGKYNKQLGSGLGKHGGSRMYKPMFKKEITLISPYFDKIIMKTLTNIPTVMLKELGGKPGFMSKVFMTDINSKKIPNSFFVVKKIRLQDASDDKSGTGITETLLKAGFDQKRLIEIFNSSFNADIKEREHMKNTILIKGDKEKMSCAE